MKSRGVWMTVCQSAARAVIFFVGLGSVAWGGFFLPQFWQQVRVNQIAAEVLEGHAFKRQTLLEEAVQAEAAERPSFCNPIYLHDAAIVRLAILDGAIAAAQPTLIDSAYAPLYDATRKALSCGPADPFAWLTLFWLDAAKHGVNPDNASYLRLSYALGPNEAWVALWRNRLAIAVFDRLSPDIASDAIHEFIKLVDEGWLDRETAAIFASATPAVQNLIMPQLRSTKAIPRQNFARKLYEMGLDVDIPGVEKAARPWQ